MRCLAGLALLLVATAAFPQTAPETDILRGRADTYEKFEIRPGITLGVQYGSDGIACHADITPLQRPLDPSWRRDTIPVDTIDSILDELLPTEAYGKRTPFFVECLSLCMEVWQAKNVTIRIGDRPLPRLEVEEVEIEFDRPPCPPPLGVVHKKNESPSTNH